MSERICYLLAWAIFLIIVYVVFNLIKRRKLLFNVLLVCVLVIFLFGGGSLINLKYFATKQVENIQEVINQVGDTYLRAEGGSVFVKVGDSWLNLNDIKVVGEFTKDVTINYDGQDIYIGHSGVYNTIKVLQDMGLLGN